MSPTLESMQVDAQTAQNAQQQQQPPPPPPVVEEQDDALEPVVMLQSDMLSADDEKRLDECEGFLLARAPRLYSDVPKIARAVEEFNHERIHGTRKLRLHANELSDLWTALNGRRPWIRGEAMIAESIKTEASLRAQAEALHRAICQHHRYLEVLITDHETYVDEEMARRHVEEVAAKQAKAEKERKEREEKERVAAATLAEAAAARKGDREAELRAELQTTAQKKKKRVAEESEETGEVTAKKVRLTVRAPVSADEREPVRQCLWVATTHRLPRSARNASRMMHRVVGLRTRRPAKRRRAIAVRGDARPASWRTAKSGERGQYRRKTRPTAR